MKPNELRIGNFVNHDNRPSRICQILKSDLLTVYNGWAVEESATMRSIKPIPLAEDILVKLGFEKIYSHQDQTHEDYHEWHEKTYPTLGCVYQGDGDYVFCEKFDDRKIYFLHELQNLYFAITGEELNVEL